MFKVHLPISVRLTLWYGLSLLLLLSAFGTFLYVGFHVGLHNELEEEMDRAADQLMPAIQTQQQLTVPALSLSTESVGYLTDGAGATFVRLLSPAGDVLYQSPNFEGRQDFDHSIPPDKAKAANDHLWEGAPTRSQYSLVRDASGTHRGWLEITRRESAIHSELHRLELLLLAGGLLGMLVAVGSGYWLAKRALRPVVMLTDAANQIQVSDLENRLPSDFGVRDELTALADTFNLMLQRLQVSFDRERRFRADAAHELFTPLSGMQSEIDVALQRPRASPYYERTLEATRDQAQRMAATLDGLLQLSRVEALQNPASQEVDFGSCVFERLSHLQANAVAGDVQLVHEVCEGAVVLAEPGHIEVIIENLFENAIKYTPAGGTVRVALEKTEEEVRLTVSDTGIGFSAHEQVLLFDRFFRSDGPSVQRTRGSGLGLSITRALTEMYGAHVTASSTGPGAGSTFEVRFPRMRLAANKA
jgi:signal transduction histidine kinase